MKINKKVEIGILTLIVIVMSLVSFVHAFGMSSEGITTTVEELDVDLVFDEVKKIYEISDSGLEKGYSAFLEEKDAFKIGIDGKSYYIVAWNITDEVFMFFPEERSLILDEKKVILADINENGELDVELRLNSIESVGDSKRANIFIKKFIERDFIPSGDYVELFDVSVMLTSAQIFDSSELQAFVVFENFGEGASEIEITYSIVDEQGEEIYRGVDSKVIQTEERVVKNFEFLKLPLGKYILKTEIFYGKNQTGESEQSFEVIERSSRNIIETPLIFIFGVIFVFILVLLVKKLYSINEDTGRDFLRKLAGKKTEIKEENEV